MSDPTQFIVSLPIVHNLLRHQGVIGIGYDLITEHKCSLHQYTDKYKRNYVTQLFDSVDSDFVSNKLNSIARYSHSLFISNIVRPVFISTRKTQKTQYQLVIFYDTTGLGELSLDQLIKSKREHSQKFQTQEIISFFWQIADFLMMSIKNNVEYLNLLPLNILCKIDGYYGYNFFISNFGKKYRSNKKLYYNPKDKFYNKTKTAETALSASMFTFGMILLQISSMLQLNDIFENNEINQKLLMKRIEAIKITNDPMISKIIKGLLQLDQTKRLKPSDIYSNSQWLKLRKVVYFPSKIDFFGYKNFQGIIQYDKKMSIGEALDNNLSMIRGTFTNGILQGRGIRQKNDTLQLGLFMNNQLIQGQIIKKNSHFDIGKYKNGIIYQGMRVYLNIANLTKEGKSLAGFLGQFQQGQPKNGQFHYSDGFIEQK